MVPLLGLNELSAESRGQSLTLEKTLTLWKLRERFSQRTVVPGALRGASMCCGVAVLRCCGVAGEYFCPGTFISETCFRFFFELLCQASGCKEFFVP